jgi:hypothetical protein
MIITPKTHDWQENQTKTHAIPSKRHKQQPLIHDWQKPKRKPVDYDPILTPKSHEPIPNTSLYH